MKLKILCFSLVLMSGILKSQNVQATEISVNEHIDGTLLNVPDATSLVIIIGGSGPLDRDGNQTFSRSNYLKKLAYALAEQNISSFRYDKRVVKQLKLGIIDSNLTFNDFVSDAESVMTYFNDLNTYSQIFIIGHSQGSLVGMLAASNQLNGLISLCGPAKNIGDTLIEQVGMSAPQFKDETERIVNQLKNGKTTTDYPQELASAFNIETQPFLISWMAYEPVQELNNLNLPVLIIHGTKDIQIPVEEAELLKSNCETCDLSIIENMNHVLFEIRGDDLENYKSYNDSSLKISEELILSIRKFVEAN